MCRSACARICCLVVFFSMCFAGASARAGGNAEYRKNCNTFAKYRARAIIWHTYNGNKTRCDEVDKGCTFAEAVEYCFYPNAYVSYRVGQGGYPPNLVTNSTGYKGGEAFGGVVAVGPDTAGIARCSMSALIDFADGPNGTTVVTIHDFTGRISAKANSYFGSAFRCVVWNSSSSTDSMLTPRNLLWDGSVRIENGQAISSGTFSLSDFVVSNGVDSTGYPVVLVAPKAGLVKTIVVNDNDLDNSVAGSLYFDVGYGIYNPDGIFVDEEAFVPTLTQLGIVALVILMLCGAIVHVRRRAQA